MKVNIKGTDYEIQIAESLGTALGQTKLESKVIQLLEKYRNVDEYTRTIAHELLHAYFYECGLEDYCDDEKLILWLERHVFEIVELANAITSIYTSKRKIKNPQNLHKLLTAQ